MARFADKMDKIAEGVTEGYQKIEDGAVGGYKKIEDSVVSGYKKIEDTVVGGFHKVADSFVNTFFAREGESAQEARDRLAAQQKAHENADKHIK